MMRGRGVRGSDRASAMLEFALVAPVFVVLLTGILAYGFYFATEIAVVVAASEGARASVAGLSSNERIALAQKTVTRVLQDYAPLVSAQNAQIVAQPASGGGQFQVTVRYDISAMALASLVPLPSSAPSFTATVSNGGY